MTLAQYRWQLAGAFLAVGALVVGCSGETGSRETTDNQSWQSLKVAYFADVSSLDPIKGTPGSDHVMLFTIYDTLINLTESLEPAPGLVESWEQENPSELILKLREGVTFHDGTPFDAASVKYNLDRSRGEGSNLASDLASIKEVKVVDVRTVEISLEQPNTSLLLVLADRAGMMVSPSANAEELATKPVGAGPWQFQSSTRGSSLSVKRFENYWNNDNVGIDEIAFTILTDAKTRTTALRSGQADIAFNVPASDVDLLREEAGLEVISAPALYVDDILIDTSSPQFSDPRVRQALGMAIDREKMVDSIYFGFAQPTSTFLPSQHWAFNESVEYKYDPEEARRLLDEAGVAEGFSFTMLTDPAHARMGETIVADWAQIDVDATLEPMEVTAAIDAFLNQRRSPIFLLAWSGRPDPATSLDALLNADSFYNVSKEAIPGFAEKIDEANSTADQAGRAAALRDAEQAVFDFAPVIPLSNPDTLIGHSSRVAGLEVNLLGKPKFTGVSLSD